MLKVQTSDLPTAGAEPAPLLETRDVPKPVGANNRLWPATRTKIRVTFTDLDATNATATGQDPDSGQFVFSAALARNAQGDLIIALSKSVKSDFTKDTVVVPGKGDNGTGPKFVLQLGAQK